MMPTIFPRSHVKHRKRLVLYVCVAAPPLRSSSVTYGFAGTLTATYQSIRLALTSPPRLPPNIPVIVRRKGGNECRLMHWGLIPHWATNPSIGMINAVSLGLLDRLPDFK